MKNSTFNRSDVISAEDQSGEMSVDELLIDKESPPNFVSQRKARTDMEQLRDELRSFQEGITSTLEKWFVKQDEKFKMFIDNVSELKDAVNFISDKYDDLKNKNDEVCKRVAVLESQSKEIPSNSLQVAELEARLDIMEQQARQCNVEISNLQERRGENLTTILLDIAALIKEPITKQDIVSIHRVPQASPNAQRPKNIIVKFSSRLLRDSFMSAVRLHKGLTSEHLKISGPPHKIFVNEHLTLKNKNLFRLTREAAKQHSFRFVWVKHGSILVRRNETSPVITVRGQKDLAKIRPEVK